LHYLLSTEEDLKIQTPTSNASKEYETNIHNNAQPEAVPIDRVQLSFRDAKRLSWSLREAAGAIFSQY